MYAAAFEIFKKVAPILVFFLMLLFAYVIGYNKSAIRYEKEISSRESQIESLVDAAKLQYKQTDERVKKLNEEQQIKFDQVSNTTQSRISILTKRLHDNQIRRSTEPQDQYQQEITNESRPDAWIRDRLLLARCRLIIEHDEELIQIANECNSE